MIERANCPGDTNIVVVVIRNMLPIRGSRSIFSYYWIKGYILPCQHKCLILWDRVIPSHRIFLRDWSRHLDRILYRYLKRVAKNCKIIIHEAISIYAFTNREDAFIHCLKVIAKKTMTNTTKIDNIIVQIHPAFQQQDQKNPWFLSNS